MSTKNFFEKFANSATTFTGSSFAFMAALAIVIVWAATGPVFQYSETWQLIINTGTTIITFLMVFLIQKAQNKINEIDTIRKWEKYILSEIELRGDIKLSEVFFKIIEESKSSQIAVNVTFNIIKYIYNNKDKYKLKIDKELETNTEFKNIALWKMKISKLA